MVVHNQYPSAAYTLNPKTLNSIKYFHVLFHIYTCIYVYIYISHILFDKLISIETTIVHYSQVKLSGKIDSCTCDPSHLSRRQLVICENLMPHFMP